jgi:hypothetical protein
MDTPAARLEKRFERKHRLIESEIGKTQKTALQQLLKEGRVVRVRAYYLAGCEPTLESESKRILGKLLSQPRLFRRTALTPRYKETQPFFRSALSKLLAGKHAIKLGVGGGDGEYFIHRDHLISMVGSNDAAALKSTEGSRSKLDDYKKLTPKIHQAYGRLTQDKGRRSIFISDLLHMSETSWEELRGWIEQEIVEKGRGQLDEGDWSAATEEQRAAAVELWGRKRLYIALLPLI